jgi:UDP:flavonoid glycosyltransferase YjiC (YdhE family)
MRVLFVSTPGLGHVFPMVPLAWALRAAGHEVMVATAGQGLTVARSGLPVVDVAPGFDPKTMMVRLQRDNPAVANQLHDLRDRQLTDLREAAVFAACTSMPLVDRTVSLAREWRPNLIVQSQIQGAGLVAAGVLDVPVIEHGFGLARTDGMAALHRVHMSEAFIRHGVGVAAEIGAIDVAPPSLLDRPLRGWSMRYLPYNGGAVMPDWLTTPPTKPRVAVTLGTVAPSRGLKSACRVIDAAEDVDAEFILVLGHVDTNELEPLPRNVRVVGWVPLTAVLPTCTAIVHHGGAGTTMTALAFGVPQLVFSGPMDRHINAITIARRGVGIAIQPDQLIPELLRKLLTDPGLLRTAQAVSAEIASLRTPAELVPDVIDFAVNARPQDTAVSTSGFQQ